MGLVHTGLKKYSMCKMKWTYFFSARGPEHLVQIHGIMDSIKYQQIKKSKPDNLC